MRRDATTEERFWAKVDKSGDCWLWTGAVAGFGYGVFQLNRVQTNAHRAAWILTNGPIEAGLNVCHRCDNPLCVRPAHMFLGTQQDNIDDMHAKGREARGERHGRRKLTQREADAVREAYCMGEPVKEIAHYYGVSEALVSLIGRGKRWSRTLTGFAPRRYGEGP